MIKIKISPLNVIHYLYNFLAQSSLTMFRQVYYAINYKNAFLLQRLINKLLHL